uniref:RING-type domain-containing protein n=1 Tax=Globodera rostochiensis TaxID=31243 RepID=A0A914HMP1_GLORO
MNPTVVDLMKRGIEIHNGVPDQSLIQTQQKPLLLILDDLMLNVNNDFLDLLFTRGSHNWNVSVIFVTQKATADQILGLVEICANVLKFNFRLTKRQKRRIAKNLTDTKTGADVKMSRHSWLYKQRRQLRDMAANRPQKVIIENPTTIPNIAPYMGIQKSVKSTIETESNDDVSDEQARSVVKNKQKILRQVRKKIKVDKNLDESQPNGFTTNSGEEEYSSATDNGEMERDKDENLNLISTEKEQKKLKKKDDIAGEQRHPPVGRDNVSVKKGHPKGDSAVGVAKSKLSNSAECDGARAQPPQQQQKPNFLEAKMPSTGELADVRQVSGKPNVVIWAPVEGRQNVGVPVDGLGGVAAEVLAPGDGGGVAVSDSADCAAPAAKFSKAERDKRIAAEEALMISVPEMAAEEPEFNSETGLTSTRYLKMGWINFVLPRVRCICVNKRAFVTLSQIEGLSVTVCFSRYGGETFSIHAWPENRSRLDMANCGDVIEVRNVVCRDQTKRERKDRYGDFPFVGLFNANSMLFVLHARFQAGAVTAFGHSRSPLAGNSAGADGDSQALALQTLGAHSRPPSELLIHPNPAQFEFLDGGFSFKSEQIGDAGSVLRANIDEVPSPTPPRLDREEADIIELNEDDEEEEEEEAGREIDGNGDEEAKKKGVDGVGSDNAEFGDNSGDGVRRQPLRTGGMLMRSRLRVLAGQESADHRFVTQFDHEQRQRRQEAQHMRTASRQSARLDISAKLPRQRLQRGDAKFYAGELELEEELRAEAGYPRDEDSGTDDENALPEPAQLRLLSRACVLSVIPAGEQTELDDNNTLNLRCPFCADFMLNAEIVFLACLHFVHLPCAWRMFRRQQFCPFCNRHAISGHPRQAAAATTTANCAVDSSEDDDDDDDDDEQQPCTSETALRRRS